MKEKMIDGKKIKTIINCKPAAQNHKTDDFHFKIPREMIRDKTIDPNKYYALYIAEFDTGK
ncbi:MAG: hypothetical protein KGY74_09530 [Candidatus Cloacimonetes bacterium]|nr:hypothetical protein [Candidatus Cloacimonadota bacterium]